MACHHADVEKRDAAAAAKRMNENFSNFKSAVVAGKGHVEDLKKNVDARSKALEEATADVYCPKERARLEEAFAEREAAAMRARRRQWTTNDFDAVCVLGKGAFGVVHLVRRKDDNMRFALKQMSKERYHAKNYRDRAYAERNCLSAARTRWFVELMATFQDTDYVYMLMEFVQGGELFKQLELRDRLTVNEARFYMAELLVAIDCVHQHGFVHRDVKPDNIVLTTEGHLKLLDFGLCKKEEAEASPGGSKNDPQLKPKRRNSKVGTPQYMAPEAYAGEAGPEADIWSWGVVMFECLYGGLPFHSGQMQGAEAIHFLAKMVRQADVILPKRLAKAKALGFMPPQADDLLRKVLCIQNMRSSVKQIMAEPFFSGVEFETIHMMVPPIVPNLSGPEDVSYFEGEGKIVQALPAWHAGPKDVKNQWAQYEFCREAAELECPDAARKALREAREGI